jgi:hypothetical protein
MDGTNVLKRAVPAGLKSEKKKFMGRTGAKTHDHSSLHSIGARFANDLSSGIPDLLKAFMIPTELNPSQ